MTVKSTAVTVGTSATRLDTADTNDPTTSSACPFNNGSVTMYVGGPTVTVATGCPVPAGTWGPSVDLDANESLWGIVQTTPVEARVLEASL